MARIAFFAERLPPDQDPISTFSYDLMCSLADQQHHIRVISTYREDAQLPPTHSRVELIRPFRRWGWLEIPRLIPSLLEFRPEVLHIIQPRAEALGGLTNALNAIPALGPLVGANVVVSSFYDLREETLRTYRKLLLSSSIVTVMNRPQQELLETFFSQNNKRTQVTILPVQAAPHTETQLEMIVNPDEAITRAPSAPSALQAFFDRFSAVIFVPGDVADHRNPEHLFTTLAEALDEFASAGVMVGGGWGRLPVRRRHALIDTFEKIGAGHRIFFSGPLSSQLQRECFEKARVVFTASLPVESLQVTHILREALVSAAPIIMSADQADADPLPWQDGQSSVIAGLDPASWKVALRSALGGDELLRGIRDRLPEFSRAEAVDQPSNIMSRVYARLLAKRRPV